MKKKVKARGKTVLAIVKPRTDLAAWEQPKNLPLVKALQGEASEADFAVFLYQAKRTGLDPLARQIYLVTRNTKRGKVSTIQTGIDGFRLNAQRSKQYAGQTKAEWCGTDGVWKDVWLISAHPHAARIGVYRTGFSEPLYVTALWMEYNPGENADFMWRNKPALMLAKCAEALALRKAFPQELSGLYATEEMPLDKEEKGIQSSIPKKGEARVLLDPPSPEPITQEPLTKELVAELIKATELPPPPSKEDRGPNDCEIVYADFRAALAKCKDQTEKTQAYNKFREQYHGQSELLLGIRAIFAKGGK